MKQRRAGRPAGRLAGWLAGCLAGWLAGEHYEFHSLFRHIRDTPNEANIHFANKIFVLHTCTRSTIIRTI